MIVYSIKPPEPVVVQGRSFGNQMVDTTRRFLGLEVHKPNEEAMPWTKLHYSNWIEGVKAKFKTGDLVTLLHVSVIPNCVPLYYIVAHVNEIHYLVRFDNQVQQPICLAVRTINGIILLKCPATLRHLTPEEVALVNLQNLQPAGSC
jgi:hypothetical protein